MTTGDLQTLLRARLPAEEWALLFEVRNGTGFARNTVRTADAIAMSTWPSRGLQLHGFELKMSRSDWQRELANPAKAEEIARFCDRWWVVVGDADIVQPGELPPTWGLLVPRKGKLAAKVEAPKLEAAPVDRLFLAALLRAATAMPEATFRARLEAEVEERVKDRKAKLDEMVEKYDEMSAQARTYANEQVANFELRISEFEKASGVGIDAWRAGDIGAAVRSVLDNGAGAARRELERTRQNVARVLQTLDEQLAQDHRRTKPGSAA